MTDVEKLEAIRADIPFLNEGVSVDAASVSPISRRVQIAGERFDAIASAHLRDHKGLAAP